jgi:hypothetical protein
MKQQNGRATSGSSRRIILGALAAALVLGGPLLHLSASPTRADCQSVNAVTIVAGTGNDACSTSVTGDGAVAQSSSVSTSSTGSTTSTTVVASSSDAGSAVALVQNSDGSSDGTVSVQSSTVPSSAVPACPQVGGAAGPTLVLGPDGVCATTPSVQTANPPAGGSLSLNSGSCGPSMVLGPGGISMSSGGC